MRTFTAHIERDPETGIYFGIIPAVPGAYAQGKTLDELRANLKEVLELCLEEAETYDSTDSTFALIEA
jgi:predicted RNase H-like HicB family nuclease